MATPEGTETGAIIVSGLDRERIAEIARNNSVNALAVTKLPKEVTATKKARVGLYRSWTGNMDEGWTRWILENYGFAPVTLRNGDIRAGHLRDRLDAIILPDASTSQIMNGFAPGSVPGQYAGGLGDPGAEALRTFVRSGGTLIAFNNASLMAIESFHLPVTNVLQSVSDEQFYCSGSLLRVELRDANHPAVWGLPREPVVMFERGPAFDTKPGFRGSILASYSQDRNPLASGYLLHPERIQGKAAALEVFYGDGRIYLIGFRPQWRAQSHGTYKLIFNTIYDSPSVAKPTTLQRTQTTNSAAVNTTMDNWRAAAAKVHTDLSAILIDNRAFFDAKGPAAVEARSKLTSAADQFERDRLTELQDATLGMDDATRRRVVEYVRALRSLQADLRTKEFDKSVDADVLFERYRIATLEQEISPSPK